ncbi:MAG: VWA domain-containing protein [Planctomycetes bacterium]|nr:VWA domain-containing protein [Planctomycetota bacterium]
MRFEAAWCWLLLPPILAYLAWLSRHSYARLKPWARWTSLGLRSLIVLALLAVLSRPHASISSKRTHLIVCVDVSKSISKANADAALDEIDRLLQSANEQAPKPRISIIAFGGGATLLTSSDRTWSGWTDLQRAKITHQRSLPQLLTRRTRLISSDDGQKGNELKELNEQIKDIERFRNTVVGDYTNIEQAMRLALNCGSIDERRTVYLLTDANFNRGDFRSTMNECAKQDAILNSVILDRPAPAEVAVTALNLPNSVRVDQGFSAEVRIESTVDTSAEMRVFKDGYEQQRRSVALRKGENRFKLSGLFLRDKGFHPIEVTLHPTDDTQIDNNTIRELVVVPGEARVLYVDSDIEQIHYLKTALELEGIRVEARSAAGVPEDLSDLLSFDALILSNVPADHLSMRQMKMIRSYVQEFGGGFLMLGGDESFGLGGYYNTPIEEILPVSMPIQKDLLRPSLGLFLVIDKSGSMNGVKIQLAKRAAIATSEAINPRDLIGVIGFDGESRVLLELTAAADRATITSHVNMLEAGGGTFLYPALDDAHRRLMESNARRRHVIVLSDGQTQGYGYEDLASLMSADGITTSTVGIGEGADMRLMESIASAGGGRAYFTNDFHTIPQIFTREALRASKSMLVERLVVPIAVGQDSAIEGIDTEELPVLTGYVATTPKPSANLILTSESGDPLLAKWRYGLGRTVAFTSEPKPRWAEDWLDWEYYAQFWSQLVRSVTGEDLARDTFLQSAHQFTDDGVKLTLDLRSATGEYVNDAEVKLSRVVAGQGVVELPVRQRAAGLFDADVGELRFGTDQQFVWKVKREGEEEQTAAYGYVKSYSPEHATLMPSEETIEELRRANLGNVVSVGHAKLNVVADPVRNWVALAPVLLIVALLLTPIDILIRRIG